MYRLGAHPAQQRDIAAWAGEIVIANALDRLTQAHDRQLRAAEVLGCRIAPENSDLHADSSHR